MYLELRLSCYSTNLCLFSSNLNGLGAFNLVLQNLLGTSGIVLLRSVKILFCVQAGKALKVLQEPRDELHKSPQSVR